MADEPMKTQGNFKLDPRMLDHFSVAMYKDAKKAIEELVANGFDADATRVDVDLPPDWKKSGAKIVVRDNGEGMLPGDITGRFLVLGYNRRAFGKKTRRGRKPIGNKGIGKLAGLGLASSMQYSTTKGGRTSRFTIDRKAFTASGRSLEENKIEIATRREGAHRGTEIELLPLHRDTQRISPEELRTHLAFAFTKHTGFAIYVNDKKCSEEDLPGKKVWFVEAVTGYGRVQGWYKTLDRPIENPGFAVRVRGRIEGQRTTFTLGPSATKAINYAYIIGDVNADFLDSDNPRHAIDEFAVATDRDGFNRSSPAYQAFEKWAVEKLKSIARDVKKVRSARAQERLAKDPAIKKSLDKLPERVQQQVLLLASRLVEEFPWETEKELFEMVKAIAKTRAMDEIVLVLRELINADPKDVKGFARLLEQYGLADLWRLAEHITNRLSLIDQFDRLTSNLDTLETKEIHPFLEKCIWIVSDDYITVSSNEEIRTFIKKELGVDSMLAANRPDFICKSRKKQLAIIEIKRASYKVGRHDFDQVCRYVDALKEKYPTTPMKVHVVGGFSSQGEGTIYLGVPVVFTTYPELIEDVKDRYKEFTRILREARPAS